MNDNLIINIISMKYTLHYHMNHLIYLVCLMENCCYIPKIYD